jgi:hypothetical protein
LVEGAHASPGPLPGKKNAARTQGTSGVPCQKRIIGRDRRKRRVSRKDAKKEKAQKRKKETKQYFSFCFLPCQKGSNKKRNLLERLLFILFCFLLCVLFFLCAFARNSSSLPSRLRAFA